MTTLPYPRDPEYPEGSPFHPDPLSRREEGTHTVGKSPFPNEGVQIRSTPSPTPPP